MCNTFKKIFNWRVWLSHVSDWLRWAVPVTATTFWGDRMRVILPDGVSAAIFCYHRYEHDLTDFLYRQLKQGDTVIDVGAHYGYFTLLAAHLVGTEGQVHAFEATPRTGVLLQENTKEKKNVFVNAVAAWNEAGHISFFDCGVKYPAGNSYKITPHDEAEKKKFQLQEIRVPAVTLDDYCREKKIRPQFVKLDAEQSEFKILQGMSRLLKECHPVISLETWGYEDAVENYRGAITLLVRSGYRAYLMVNGHLTEYQPQEPYPFTNVIFLPLH